MSTVIGQEAEEAAAEYLRQQGYKIEARNWRTRWCEIDIVAKQAETIHFVEVKFRKSTRHGSGLEYITSTKIKQLKKGALFWISEHGWEGDYQIDAISVDGETGSIKMVSNAIMG